MARVYIAEKKKKIDGRRKAKVNFALTGLTLSKHISMQFHTAGETKSVVYLVPYDDTSMENSLRA